jgi:hypothetical protein
MIRFIGSQGTAVALLLCLSSAPAFAEEAASEPEDSQAPFEAELPLSRSGPKASFSWADSSITRSASEARAAHLVNQLAAEQHLQTQMQ